MKIDGEFNFIIYNDHGICTINKYGTRRDSFAELLKVEILLNQQKIISATMLCELYWGDGKQGDLYKLLSHKQDNYVHLAIFDLYELNGKALAGETLIERKEKLWNILGDWQSGSKVVTNEQEALKCFADAKVKDYEGIVLKSLDSPLILGPCDWVKMKYKDRNDYPVSVVDPTKERIEITVDTPDYQGIIRTVLVGCKAPNRYKKNIKVGDIVTIEHQGILESGSLRHPVLIPKKEWK